MQKITEKRILAVSAQSLLLDGSQAGEITIADTSVFRVGQLVTLASDTQDYANFQVKRILKNSFIYLGKESKPIQDRSDLSSFLVADGAKIFAREQKRPSIPEQEIERHTYEEEPVVARRVILVDKYGERFSESNPLPTSGDITVTAGAPVIETSFKDLDDGNPTYIGKSNGETTWVISRLTETGKDLAMRYADISNNELVLTYADAWTNRATLTYDI